MLKAKFQVVAIFVGKRREAEDSAGQVNALLLSQHAPVDDLALDVVAVDTVDAQLNKPVGQEYFGTGFHFLG